MNSAYGHCILLSSCLSTPGLDPISFLFIGVLKVLSLEMHVELIVLYLTWPWPLHLHCERLASKLSKSIKSIKDQIRDMNSSEFGMEMSVLCIY